MMGHDVRISMYEMRRQPVMGARMAVRMSNTHCRMSVRMIWLGDGRGAGSLQIPRHVTRQASQFRCHFDLTLFNLLLYTIDSHNGTNFFSRIISQPIRSRIITSRYCTALARCDRSSSIQLESICKVTTKFRFLNVFSQNLWRPRTTEHKRVSGETEGVSSSHARSLCFGPKKRSAEDEGLIEH